jgi:hypothetical protein
MPAIRSFFCGFFADRVGLETGSVTARRTRLFCGVMTQDRGLPIGIASLKVGAMIVFPSGTRQWG